MQEWERDRNERERIQILRDLKRSRDQEQQSAALRRLSGKPGVVGEFRGLAIRMALCGGILFLLAVIAGIFQLIAWVSRLFGAH